MCNVDIPLCDEGDVLLVDWVDSRYLTGWHNREEIVSWAGDHERFRSVGFFILCDERQVVMSEIWNAPGWEKKAAGGINSIPRSAIVRVEVLKAARQPQPNTDKER